ncbi:helix-turn-helix transcriptional regulator [Fusibacter sp. JL298sf-3]
MKSEIMDRFFDGISRQHNAEVTQSEFVRAYRIKMETGELFLERIRISSHIQLVKTTVKGTVYTSFDNRCFGDNYLEIGYAFAGESDMLTLPDKERMHIDAGDVFLYKMKNNVPYFKFRHREGQSISVSFGSAFIKEVSDEQWAAHSDENWNGYLDQLFKNDRVLEVHPASERTREIAAEIVASDTTSWMSFILLKSKVLEMVATILSARQRDCSVSARLVEQVAAIVKQDVASAPKLEELSRRCHCSIYKIQTAFKKEMGMTVYHFIKRERVEAAKALLENTDASVMVIAGEVGYENPSKFASVFDELVGMTPLKYRKDFRGRFF